MSYFSGVEHRGRAYSSSCSPTLSLKVIEVIEEQPPSEGVGPSAWLIYATAIIALTIIAVVAGYFYIRRVRNGKGKSFHSKGTRQK